MRLQHAAAAALALACVRSPTPPTAEVEAVRAAVAGCPTALPDGALREPATYATCRLPSAVAVLVRNDYGDDASAPPDLTALAALGGSVPRAAFEAQLARVVDPGRALLSWIRVDARRELLLPDPVLAPEVAIPFAPDGGITGLECQGDCRGRILPPLDPGRPYRPARRAELLAAAAPDRPLSGLRVAIDPGHAGGPYGEMEDRHIAWRAAPGGREIVLQEGDLTLRTALELRAKLTARGAAVHLTREGPGFGSGRDLASFRRSAEAMLRHVALDPAYERIERGLAPEERLRLHVALALEAVKRANRLEALRARAQGASRAGADLLLSIHFNASPGPIGAPGPQELVAMVAGNVDRSRIFDPAHRARALRLALAPDDLGASAHLAALCLSEASALLAIPVARGNRYADHLPLVFADGASRGVDAWDGALLRWADVPAALVEGPSMTDPDEMGRLDAALAAAPGTPGTRLEVFAEGLARGIERFASRWRESERNPFGAAPP